MCDWLNKSYITNETFKNEKKNKTVFCGLIDHQSLLKDYFVLYSEASPTYYNYILI